MRYLREYGKMKENAERMDALYRMLCAKADLLDESARTLRLPWEGQANKQYLLRLEIDLLDLERYLLRIGQAVQLFGEAIAEYQKTESVVEQMIAGLPI